MVEKPALGDPCNSCGLCCRLITCSTGSFALGLVANWGERAAGPCPALTLEPDGRSICGLVARPKDWMPDHPRGVTPLRESVKLLIGAGSGCDEPDDVENNDEFAKAQEMARKYIDRIGIEALQRAASILREGKK